MKDSGDRVRLDYPSAQPDAASARQDTSITIERSAGESEIHYRDAVMATLDGILVVDKEGTIRFANPAAEALLGQGKQLRDHPFGLPLAGDDFAELDRVAADGSHMVIEMHVGPILWNGLDAHVVTVRNITDRKAVERRLKESEERYALAARGANDGVWDWDLLTNRLYTSPRWREIVGCTEADMTEAPADWLDRTHPDDVNALREAIDRHLAAKSDQFVHEHRLLHRDGSYVPVLSRGAAVGQGDGQPERFAGSLTDLTAQKQLSYEALHDELTHLGNRTLFIDHLEKAIGREQRVNGGFGFAVLFLDLDNFKLVNDSLGHTAGDELLIEVAGRIQNCLRSADIGCRLGGDEFAILLNDVADLSSVLAATRRIQKEIARPMDLGGESVYTSASIGIAFGGDSRPTAEDVVRNADMSMYRAKRRGQGNLEIFDRRMHAEAVKRLRLQTDLRRGVDSGEFLVWYQPMVNLRDWKITGFEALLRWRHPKGDVDVAERFVETAEETGMIVPMSWLALRESCTQVQAWRKINPDLRVSVNVSNRQFAQTDFVDRIRQGLDEAEIDGSAIQLEITERVVMQDHEAATSRVQRCHALGLEVLVDDFGTGQSSLTALHRLPIDAVKIDRSFVNRLEAKEGGEIVEAILALADSLGLRVVAEGIETQGQRRRLLQLGCDIGQGYLFAHALEEAKATRLLIEGISGTERVTVE